MSDDSTQKVLVDYLRHLQQSGITDLPSSPNPIETQTYPQPGKRASGKEFAENERASDNASMVRESTAVSAATDSAPDLFQGNSDEKIANCPDLADQERSEQLKVLATEVAACQKCPDLVGCRTQTVFGVGNVRPRLVFLGEGPGADEDRLGEPFVGKAGQLLNKIIEACKMHRSDVYILNTVKCRPPGNRNPSEHELANCWHFAEKQLEVLKPEFICCLGSVAAKKLLNSADSVGRMRGKFHSFRGVPVVVTYHPAYLLRSPEAKSKTWDDMKMLLDAMGIDYRQA